MGSATEMIKVVKHVLTDALPYLKILLFNIFVEIKPEAAKYLSGRARTVPVNR
jgi:hypothetical protein